MANWDVPDYNMSEEIDYYTLHKRILAEDPNALLKWDNEGYPVQKGYAPATVQEFCVRNQEWQQVRLSMKGKATHKKLAILAVWYDEHAGSFRAEVQVGNYLGALRRGGQLDQYNRIRKYL